MAWVVVMANDMNPQGPLKFKKNPLADSTCDELKIVKVGFIPEKIQVVTGFYPPPLPRCWICTLRTETGGYHTGKGPNPAEALDDALRALAEKRPL